MSWFRLRVWPGKLRFNPKWHKRREYTTDSWCMPLCEVAHNGILGYDTNQCETTDDEPPVEDQCKNCRKKIEEAK